MIFNQRAWIEISEAAIIHNTKQIRSCIKDDTDYMAVIKGNAWGCGVLPAARIFSKCGVDWIGVTRLENGVKIRDAGIDIPILVLCELPACELKIALKYDFSLTVCNSSTIDFLSALSKELDKEVRVHLKINTGLNRWGAKPFMVDDCIKRINRDPHLSLDGIFSHFLSADKENKKEEVQKQFQIFNTLLDRISDKGIDIKYKHIANTPATIAYPETQLDLVRIGVGNYGVYPGPHLKPLINLKPVISLKAEVAHINQVKSGERVGYGGVYKPEKDTNIGILSLGYSDGLPYSMVGSKVLINSYQCSVVAGAMDVFFIDLKDYDIDLGDVAVIVGKEESSSIILDKVVASCNRGKEEFLAQLSPKIERVVI